MRVQARALVAGMRLSHDVVGFIRGFIGQLLLGQWGPSIAGVYVVQTFVGSLVFILVAKWIMGKLAKR